MSAGDVGAKAEDLIFHVRFQNGWERDFMFDVAASDSSFFACRMRSVS